MVTVDLVTGFLGAGKTTFLKKYASYWLRQGKKVCILENDFGAVNVDMMLLQGLMKEGCSLEMVSGAYDADCYRRRFKTKLISMGMTGYDRVLIEPSGLFDIDDFFDALHEEPLDRWYEIGSVIAITDAALDDALSRPSDCLLAEQIANAGILVLSRVQEVSDGQLKAVREHLNRALQTIHCDRILKDTDFLCKDWNDLSDSDYDRIAHAGYRVEDYIKFRFDESKGYGALSFLNPSVSKEKLEQVSKVLFSEDTYGHIVRIKGFLREEDVWLECNATRHQISFRPIEQGQDALIVIGEALKKEQIEALIRS